MYVDKEHRHQGHFTSLFQHTIKLAKQKGVKRIKLYAENNNEVAKGIYFKLGMRISLIKLYSFDFVIGGCKINDIVDKRFVFEEK